MFSFKLPDDFIDQYENRKVDWGYPDAAGNALGEITFIRSYSRVKDDGTKERWHEVCRRVIEGMFSIQKDHCIENRIPWSGTQALKAAKEAYERMFTFKWLPPGRGIWMMGTEYVNGAAKNSAALQNCSFVSTADITAEDPAEPFVFLMEASMLGIGVGFDTLGGYRGLVIHAPDPRRTRTFTVPDSREGWVESVSLLINSYLKPGQPAWRFDYSQVRPAGAPIRGFGGTASGPDPLIKLHESLMKLFSGRAGTQLSTIDIVDVSNLIGVCVVAGNVRRSAEIALGLPSDQDFVDSKNPERFPERNSYDPAEPGWGWMSNNSLSVKVGDDYSPFVENIVRNGEPGFVWNDLARAYGRLADEPENTDWRVMGTNPCGEMNLESFEMCTLVEAFLHRHDTLDDFLRTLKFAYLYAKTVTLVSTHWPRTNAVMQRNRRIGCSISGIASFLDANGQDELVSWMEAGYGEIGHWDRVYSEWLCARESIKRSTVKPSGSVSIVAGSTPGVHWSPGGRYFLRTIRFGSHDPMVPLFEQAGYRVEDDVVSAGTKVVHFPIHSEVERSEKDVSIEEKTALAVLSQRHWSDNSVSVTVSFDATTEADKVGKVLTDNEGKLKSISFLPMGDRVYPQQPYTQITQEEYESYLGTLRPISFSPVYDGTSGNVEAEGEAYCSTDVCEIPSLRTPGAAEFEDNDSDAGRERQDRPEQD